MSTPNQAYRSNSVILGGFSTTLYRPTDVDNPGTNPTALGTYYVETATLNYTSRTTDRPDIDGGDNGFVVITGPITGSATIQSRSGTQTTPLNGDFFTISDASIEADASSAPNGGAAVSRRCVVHDPTVNPSKDDYRKYTCSLRVDKFNS